MSGDVSELVIAYRAVAELTADPRNARTHPQQQIDQIAASIRSFGFANPLLIDESGRLIAGHGRLRAARAIGLDRVPTITLAGLSAAQRRALMLADNRIAANAGWDMGVLTLELGELAEMEFDLALTGFAADEILRVLGGVVELGDGLASPARAPASPAPPTPTSAPPTPKPFALSEVEGCCATPGLGPSTSLRANGGGSHADANGVGDALGGGSALGPNGGGDHAPAPRIKPGDIWQMGDHWIGCGDVRDRDFVARLVGDADVAGLVVTLAVDPAAVEAMVACFAPGTHRLWRSHAGRSRDVRGMDKAVGE